MDNQRSGDGDAATQTSARSVSLDLAQLLIASRVNAGEGMERLLEQTQRMTTPWEPMAGEQLLLFVCAETPCAASLIELREVLPSLPPVVALPFSPPWLLGVFPLRTEMIGLVDPAVILTGRADAHSKYVTASEAWGQSDAGAQQSLAASLPSGGPVNSLMAKALLVGEGERSLAIAVNAVGDIALAQPEEVTEDVSTLPAPAPFLHPYISGVYRPRGEDGQFLVLRLSRLLEDMLSALEHAEAANNG